MVFYFNQFSEMCLISFQLIEYTPSSDPRNDSTYSENYCSSCIFVCIYFVNSLLLIFNKMNTYHKSYSKYDYLKNNISC